MQFNLGNFPAALDLFRAVVYFGELPTSSIPADRKLALVKEAKKDYVRTWPHVGSPEAAFEDFKRVGGEAGVRDMIRTLGDIYWTDGQDREAILVYHRLIRQDPVAPDAPILQSRIVTMAGRMGKKDVAVQQAHVFVKILEDFEASPRGKDPANAKLTAEARSTAENTLRYLALRYHNEWKKTDDQAVAGFAISVYADYLAGLRRQPLGLRDALLPRRAALRPGPVRRGRRRVRPAWSCSTWPPWRASRSRRAAARPAPRPASGSTTPSRARSSPTRRRSRPCRRCPRPRPAPRSSWPWPRSGSSWPRPTSATSAGGPTASWPPRRPTAAPSSATTTTTTPRPSTSFTRVALDHPGAEEAEYATNLVLDAYNELGDWRNLNGWAKRFFANQALVSAHPKLKDDLPKVIEQSAFKIIEEQEKARDWEAAAESYLAFVRDWPNTRLAPTALYNASVDYARASRVDKAMEVREQLLQRFPDDPLAPRCLFDNASGYEAIADFQRAADAYERYFREWRRTRGGAAGRPRRRPGQEGRQGGGRAAPAPAPAPAYEEKKALDAIVNAAVFRAGLRDWARAEADSLAYLEVWPDGEDAARLSLSLADLAARQGPPQKELTPARGVPAAPRQDARRLAGGAAAHRPGDGEVRQRRRRAGRLRAGLRVLEAEPGPGEGQGAARRRRGDVPGAGAVLGRVPEAQPQHPAARPGVPAEADGGAAQEARGGVHRGREAGRGRAGGLLAGADRPALQALRPRAPRGPGAQGDQERQGPRRGLQGAAGRAGGAAGDQGAGRLRAGRHQGPRARASGTTAPPGPCRPPCRRSRSSVPPWRPCRPWPPSRYAERPRGYPLLSALEPAAPAARRGPAPVRSGVAPAPPLKQPAPAKAAPTPGAKGKPKEPPPPASDDPLPRPKKGDDEDLLQ